MSSGIACRRFKAPFLLRKPYYIIVSPLLRLPYFKFVRESADHHEPITFELWFLQKVIGINREATWPVSSRSKVVGAANISVGRGSNPGINPGCYVQGAGRLSIGNYCIFGPNVGLLSGNHDCYDQRRLLGGTETVLGDYCWIGMNSVILPGVTLGDFTIVAAGSVVKHSFPGGYCIIAGNPARKVRDLERTRCVKYKNRIEYVGYTRASRTI